MPSMNPFAHVFSEMSAFLLRRKGLLDAWQRGEDGFIPEGHSWRQYESTFSMLFHEEASQRFLGRSLLPHLGSSLLEVWRNYLSSQLPLQLQAWRPRPYPENWEDCAHLAVFLRPLGGAFYLMEWLDPTKVLVLQLVRVDVEGQLPEQFRVSESQAFFYRIQLSGQSKLSPKQALWLAYERWLSGTVSQAPQALEAASCGLMEMPEKLDAHWGNWQPLSPGNLGQHIEKGRIATKNHLTWCHFVLAHFPNFIALYLPSSIFSQEPFALQLLDKKLLPYFFWKPNLQRLAELPPIGQLHLNYLPKAAAYQPLVGKNLSHLQLHNGQATGVPPLFDTWCLPLLKEVVLSNWPLLEALPFGLLKSPKLSSLSLLQLPLLRDFSGLEQAKNLTLLVLKGLRYVQDEDFYALAYLPKLVVINCPLVEGQFVNKLPQLRSLEISFSEEGKLWALLKLVSNLKSSFRLQRLRLVYQGSLEEATQLALRRWRPNQLQNFSFEFEVI